MAKSCDSIVLCKEVPEQTLQEHNYLTTLQSAGYNCNYLYTSRFIFINTKDLKRWLQRPEIFDGLILSNQHDVEAIYNIFKDDKTSLSSWQKLPAYCVGPAIASLAKKTLGLKLCLGSEIGNTNDLAENIISRKALIAKLLLYPCSEIPPATFEQALSRNSIYLFKLVTYRNVIRQSFKDDVLNNISTTPKIFVFFSPLCVDYFVSILREYPDCIKNVKAVAIDPTTEESLIKAKFVVYATAANPNPTALLEAIDNVNCNSNSDTTM